MLSHSDFTIYSLWLILVPVLIISRSIMAIGSKLRGTDIANADRRNKKSITVVLTPLFVLVFLSVFAPIVLGRLRSYFFGGGHLSSVNRCIRQGKARIDYHRHLSLLPEPNVYRNVSYPRRIRAYGIFSRTDYGHPDGNYITMDYRNNPLDGAW